MASDTNQITELGVLTLSDTDWAIAQKRMAIISPLAALDAVGHQAADNAAHMLGLSRRRQR